jgi:hypothetical protein
LLQTKVIPNYKSSPSDKEIFKKIQKDILKWISIFLVHIKFHQKIEYL